MRKSFAPSLESNELKPLLGKSKNRTYDNNLNVQRPSNHQGLLIHDHGVHSDLHYDSATMYRSSAVNLNDEKLQKEDYKVSKSKHVKILISNQAPICIGSRYKQQTFKRKEKMQINNRYQKNKSTQASLIIVSAFRNNQKTRFSAGEDKYSSKIIPANSGNAEIDGSLGIDESSIHDEQDEDPNFDNIGDQDPNSTNDECQELSADNDYDPNPKIQDLGRQDSNHENNEKRQVQNWNLQSDNEQDQCHDENDGKFSLQMVKYPKSVVFIIGNEFCERFNYYGMRTILVLYLTRRLSYDDDTATVLFHVFTSLVYFFPLFGAIIADSYLGRFNTILTLSIVYAVGTVIIAVGAIPPLMLPAQPVTVLGLILIALGTGGIKPCVSAFGGDQFKLPEQAKQLASFFSLFYFSINAGSLVSTTLTPIFREDVHCFGENDCFPLAFGVPAILMVLSIVVFIWGKSLYVIKAPCGNMILAVFKCITEAIRKRSSSKEIKTHWLDYAEDKYGSRLVEDTKALLKILVLYLPLPVFWALFDQQGSRWTFQATKMVGHITGSFSIKPDQMQVVNPLLILMFIPIFDYAIYPLLAKCGFKRPLQKITIGGLLAAVAFLLSGLVQVAIEKDGPIIPKYDESQLRIFNGMPCAYQISSNIPGFCDFTLDKMGIFEETVLLDDTILSKFDVRGISDSSKCKNFTSEIQLLPGKAVNYFIKSFYEVPMITRFQELGSKHRQSQPLIRVLLNVDKEDGELTAVHNEQSIKIDINELVELSATHYMLKYNNIDVADVDVHAGSVYIFMIQGNSKDGFLFNSHLLIKPNSVHMLWQLPQYIVITAGEVMFSVTGLEFSFTQAPASMKSVLQACWLLTVAFGNMLVVFIAEFSKFQSQALEFFSFAILMFLDMIIFMILAMKYTYKEIGEDTDSIDKKKNSSRSTSDIESQDRRNIPEESIPEPEEQDQPTQLDIDDANNLNVNSSSCQTIIPDVDKNKKSHKWFKFLHKKPRKQKQSNFNFGDAAKALDNQNKTQSS